MGDRPRSETPASIAQRVTEVRKLSHHAKAADQEREQVLGDP